MGKDEPDDLRKRNKRKWENLAMIPLPRSTERIIDSLMRCLVALKFVAR